MPKINLLKDSSSFSEVDVEATTVGQLRDELDLSGYTVNVDRTVVRDTHELNEGSYVAAVRSNKTGGKRKA